MSSPDPSNSFAMSPNAVRTNFGPSLITRISAKLKLSQNFELFRIPHSLLQHLSSTWFNQPDQIANGLHWASSLVSSKLENKDTVVTAPTPCNRDMRSCQSVHTYSLTRSRPGTPSYCMHETKRAWCLKCKCL